MTTNSRICRLDLTASRRTAERLREEERDTQRARKVQERALSVLLASGR